MRLDAICPICGFRHNLPVNYAGKKVSCRACSADGDCTTSWDRCLTLANDVGASCLQSCEAGSPYGCLGALGTRDCCPTDTTCTALAGTCLRALTKSFILTSLTVFEYDSEWLRDAASKKKTKTVNYQKSAGMDASPFLNNSLSLRILWLKYFSLRLLQFLGSSAL